MRERLPAWLPAWMLMLAEVGMQLHGAGVVHVPCWYALPPALPDSPVAKPQRNLPAAPPAPPTTTLQAWACLGWMRCKRCKACR